MYFNGTGVVAFIAMLKISSRKVYHYFNSFLSLFRTILLVKECICLKDTNLLKYLSLKYWNICLNKGLWSKRANTFAQMNPNFAKEGYAGDLPGALRLKPICMKWRKLQLPSELIWRHRQPQLRQNIAQRDLWMQTRRTSLLQMKVATGNRVSLHESYLDTFTPTFQVQ